MCNCGQVTWVPHLKMGWSQVATTRLDGDNTGEALGTKPGTVHVLAKWPLSLGIQGTHSLVHSLSHSCDSSCIVYSSVNQRWLSEGGEVKNYTFWHFLCSLQGSSLAGWSTDVLSFCFIICAKIAIILWIINFCLWKITISENNFCRNAIFAPF